MIQVAVRRIERDGMTVGLDRIRMEEVIAEAGVSRASAYRRWPSRDAFLAEVLVAAVRHISLIPETEQDLARVMAVVEEHWSKLGTEQGRRNLVVEALREAVDADVRRLVVSPHWRTFLSLSATLPGLPEGDVRDAVAHALQETEEEVVARRVTIYAGLAELIGYRLAGLGDLRTLSSAAGAMMTGLVLRASSDPAWLDRREAVALYDADRPSPWSEPERHLVGVLLAHLQPDPEVAWNESLLRARLDAFKEQVAALLAAEDQD